MHNGLFISVKLYYTCIIIAWNIIFGHSTGMDIDTYGQCTHNKEIESRLNYITGNEICTHETSSIHFFPFDPCYLLAEKWGNKCVILKTECSNIKLNAIVGLFAFQVSSRAIYLICMSRSFVSGAKGLEDEINPWNSDSESINSSYQNYLWLATYLTVFWVFGS